MEYILVSENIVNAFVTTIQKHCGISSPIKLSYIPQILEQFQSNESDFIDSYIGGFPIDAKVLSRLTYLRPYAFYAYGFSIYAEFTSVEQIGEYAFHKCSKPLAIGFPSLKTIDKYAFFECTSLSSIKLPNVQYIGSCAFQGCTALSSVYITTKTVPTLANYNAFLSTPIASTGSIFVDASMIDIFKTANQWSFYSSRITKV